VDLRAGLEALMKGKSVALPGIECHFIGRPVCSLATIQAGHYSTTLEFKGRTATYNINA
jgi:hypothetical protein